MAPWLNHPRYVPTRERLIGYLQSDRYRFRRLDPVILLCGGADSSRRATLRDYLRRHNPKLSLFYAERVWEHIASRATRGALKMEEDLAHLADLLIIIVESPGTFAELGAFSLSESLRLKLLPIVDTAYRHEQSFIATGPLRWIDAESTISANHLCAVRSTLGSDRPSRGTYSTYSTNSLYQDFRLSYSRCG